MTDDIPCTSFEVALYDHINDMLSLNLLKNTEHKTENGCHIKNLYINSIAK